MEKVPAMRQGLRTKSPASLKRARSFRSEMSISEKRLWSFIRKKKLGFQFNRQVRLGKYYLDFFCAEASLCIEVDGEQHSDRPLQDGLRDDWLALNNIETIRIPSLDLFENSNKLGDWLDFIQRTCERRTGRSSFE